MATKGKKKSPVEPHPPSTFSTAGIAVSAGELQPFLDFLEALPDSPGLALIVIVHPDGRDVTELCEIAAKKTRLPVTVAVSGTRIAPDHVYLMPPSSYVLLENGHIHLQPLRDGEHGLVVDALFRSLAVDQGSRAIGVLLTRSGLDGILGTKVIKVEGGITFALDGAPVVGTSQREPAIAGAIDFALPPRAIARELAHFARGSYMTPAVPHRFAEKDLVRIFEILHLAHEVDFTHYKPSTIERRIRRRMTMHRYDSVGGYIKMLEQSPTEVEQLYNDVLIRVTGFFRDPTVFEVLQSEVIPNLLRDHGPNDPVRVWVPGCATGEEVYSIAIAFVESIGKHDHACPMQIFGTDISANAVERARTGIFPDDIAAEMSPERLERFFTKIDGGYRVSQSLRDCCIFARQNVTTDPPFSRLDLISCRNVMIYLGHVLQRKVMSMFHYALRPNGVLLLGSSETIGAFGDLFAPIDRKHKIYARKGGAGAPIHFGFGAPARRQPAERPRMDEESLGSGNVFREADRVLLSRFSPPGVLINDNFEILQFRGRTSPFLEPAPGTATFNLLKMAREGILGDLRGAIHAARRKDIPVRREGIRVSTDGPGTINANLEVLPFRTAAGEHFFIILFEEGAPVPEAKAKGRGKKAEEPDPRHVTRLKRELESTREYLQSIIEEQEAMNEELRSANEEIQSSNEELQSTNEELETAKEELQSSNEELTTLNEELANRNDELARVNDDLVNLLASVEMPIVMLDAQMRIRRFNPGAQRVLNLIAGDIGRPFADLKPTLDANGLDDMISGVIDTLEVREERVQHRNGQRYSMRIRPYKTAENKIEGAVIVLVDVKE
jgi:two-component system, chemotaxis family, CheB/CheR fusion protein